jgi:16S rRNA (guanine1516-N2)-methyltransferase
LSETAATAPGARLGEHEGRLELRFEHRPDWAPLSADWLGTEQRRRIQAGRKQLMARALGLHKKNGLSIIDATAGFGRDGFTMAALGAQVTLVERQPEIAALLRDACARAAASAEAALSAAAARCRIVQADARSWLRTQAPRVDAVHLDPMYPDDGKSALPQKALQAIRALAGDDRDADELLDAALASGASRVVVKRPSKAPWLAGRAPTLTFSGTQARYDVYLAAATHSVDEP